MDDVEVRHDAAASRYELVADGAVIGLIDYRAGTDADVFTHTEVAPAHRGTGLAVVLVRAALDDVRARGRTVVPQCWYVADFLRDNPEYQDLSAA